MPRFLPAILVLCCLVSSLPGAAPPVAEPGRDLSVEELARRARPSVVVVRTRGRDGATESVGTGFVIAADGLIATNQHVVGEGRSVTVELADGKTHDVVTVHASDRKNDLAIVKINVKGLTPLPLGDPARLVDGQPVVALGNPRGLKHSVVAGVVSGRRTFDGRSMIQVAIPIEPGNSGGPLLDRRGRVVGIMTIKSLVTANLGFAMPTSALAPLIHKPNPVAMSAWMTIGALDPDEWKTRGGRWRQRAGRIVGEGTGAGVGRRGLCIAQRAVPALPFEVAVTVKLDDEAGAAGLVFHSDGGDNHYGFYPSAGQLRLARFSGPDVFSWTVLAQKASPHYRSGEWNILRVRLDRGRIRCFVNDQPVFDHADDTFTSGKVGLVRFRDAVAEFKQFRLGKSLPALAPPAALRTLVAKLTPGLSLDGPVRADMGRKLPTGGATLTALREQARLLEQQAARLRQLAAALHQKAVLDDLAKMLGNKEGDVDLVHAALLIAKLDNDEVDVDAYRAEVDRLARKVLVRLKKGAGEGEKLAVLERYLFGERGFHGSRGDYYNRSNSYLSEVLDDREGLPITLSVLYIELARRLGVRVEGVGLPGHFVVRHVPKAGKTQLIDVYEGGARMSLADARRKVRSLGRDLEDGDLKAVPGRMIVVRMFHNLLNVAQAERDSAGALRYLDGIVAVHPQAVEERGMRAVKRYQGGDLTGALADVDWLLENKPNEIDLARVKQMKSFLERAVREREGKR
jgi:regulator of sirC expression with transglutaminase-like and TPR domain